MAKDIASPLQTTQVERIIWHCGFRKTGTTTIQAGLAQNKALLAPFMAVFPRAQSTRGLRKAADRFWAEDSPQSRTRVKKAVRALVRQTAAEGHKQALVSDENTLGEHMRLGDETLFDFAARMLPLIAEVAAPAQSVFVICTRESEAWLRSAYNQRVKMRRCTASWEEWRAAASFADDMAAECERLVARTGLDIRYLSFEDEVAGGHWPGLSLLDLCGVPRQVWEQAEIARPRENTSLPKGALDFMLLMNRSDIDDAALRKVRKAVMNNLEHFKQ